MQHISQALSKELASSKAACISGMQQRISLLQGSATPKRGTAEIDVENARALGNAMLVCTTIPWGLCVVFYFGKYDRY